MDLFEPDSLRLPDAMNVLSKDMKRPPQHKKGEKFLKGPIPWNWISMAAKVSGKGKALHVATALWFIAGIKNNRTIILSYNVLKEMGVKRNAVYRGLDALEETGLVSTIRHDGCCPIVTINDFLPYSLRESKIF